MRRHALLLAALLATGCGEEEILHRLDEGQANQVLAALGEAGLGGRSSRAQGEDAGLSILVPGAEAAEARRVLAARDLPRARAPGFSDLFGSPGLVPTPVEERARYLHALSGELSRSLETLDGVVGARVHLALPPPDPLRPEAPRAPRAAVLLRCRPEARARLEGQVEGLRRVVAGAAEGLEPSGVAVVIAEVADAPPRPRARRASPWLLGGAGVALFAAAALAALAWRRRKVLA